MKYLKLSLKWTHKNAEWLTFWKGNRSGYCWFKDWCGLYDIEEDDDHVKHINSELIESDWIEITYDGKKQLVLPNTPSMRKKLGIKKNQLISQRKD